MGHIDTDAIRDRLPVAQYAEYHLGVELRRSGKELRGPCPICESRARRPFCVYDKIFVCHACDAKGDVIDLCRLASDLTFQSAAKKLAELAGLDTEEQSQSNRREVRTAREAKQTLKEKINQAGGRAERSELLGEPRTLERGRAGMSPPPQRCSCGQRGALYRASRLPAASAT